MKYIHFVLVVLCIVLTAFVTPACAAEVNAMIYYSENFINPLSDFSLGQGYSIKVIDISPVNGMSMIDLYLDGKKIDSDMQFAKEDMPFEYIKTVIDEDGKEIDFLVIRITPIEVVDNPLSVKFKTEQFLDPELKAAEYLILDKTKSITIGTPLELEEDYTLKASDLTNTSIILTLSKNGHSVKEEKLEKGDMFTYSKTVNGKVITVFIAKLYNFFVGTDSEVVFLKQVSQRADVVVESSTIDSVIITVENANSNKLRDGDLGIIRYTIENEGISEINILLDSEQVDHRSSVEIGTYSTVIETLNAGIHEVVVTTVANDGTMLTHTKIFTVEASIASEAVGFAANVASEAASDIVEKIGEDNETVEYMFELSGFGSMISVMMLGLVFISIRRVRHKK